MVYLSKIYTKSGDGGQTGLGDGSRVEKDSIRVTAYGEVDELNATLGLLSLEASDELNAVIRLIQHDLFDLGADLCVPHQPEEEPGKMLRITADQVTRLEKLIDSYNESLEPLSSFVLPGGSRSSAYLHLCRTVCRRAERAVCTLMRADQINTNSLIYLNRLSDLLFVLGRYANNMGKNDILWVPGKNRQT
jgi:cob(I)alamin adenosyltransferase